MRNPLILTYLSILLLSIACNGGSEASQTTDLTQYVNPLIGTDSDQGFSRGNTYPAISMPHGMVAWTPQTGQGGWAYQYQKNKLQGIKATHQPSPWMGDYGQFLLMPVTSFTQLDLDANSATFSHDQEEAHPHHYKVSFTDKGITAEITPTMRGGMFRFSYPADQEKKLLWNVGPGEGSVKLFPAEGRIEGLTRNNSGGVPAGFACYFVAEFEESFSSYGIGKGDNLGESTKESIGIDLTAWVGFDSGKNNEVIVRVATSFISLAQAKVNLKNEVEGQSFDAVATAAQQEWNEVLSRMEVEGASSDQMTTFYSGLYRLHLFPRIFHEPDAQGNLQHYSPYDGQIHPGVMYVDNGFWDTFRAVFPFYSLLYPERDAEILQGLVNTYKEGDRFPKWTSPGYRSVMIGAHCASLFADAWHKGIRDFDVETAYEGTLRDALAPASPNGTGRVGNELYHSLGYVPTDQVHEATARTLEFAYGDFCTGQLAKALDKKQDAQFFYHTSNNYQNVFDPEVGFMRGKNADGTWRPDFNPKEWGGPFTEGSAWHYIGSVMHDPAGLVKMMGGKAAFGAKMDSMFTAGTDFEVGSYGGTIHEMREMTAGDMGQYAHGNQPAHHLLYMYHFADQPWKTQYWVREAMDKLYGPGPDGYLGDEDNGQMSAWYLFSALGFYPVCPGVPQYIMGAPLFPKVTLHFPSGKSLEIVAPNNSAANRYIQSAQLNDQPLERSWLQHEELVNGGKLVLEMGPAPNEQWGITPTTPAYSLSEAESVDGSTAKAARPVEKQAVAQPEIISEGMYFRDSQRVNVTCQTPGAQLHYTLDGSIPTAKSPIITVHGSIDKTAHLQVIAFKEGMYKSALAAQRFVQLTHDFTIDLLHPPHPNYTGGGAMTLLDGEKGSTQYGNGQWLGFQEVDVEAVVDLREMQMIQGVGVNFLEVQGAWIFLPKEVDISLSQDGKTYTPVGRSQFEVEQRGANQVESIYYGIKGTKGRYIRVRATNVGRLPAWHPGAGGKAWIFVDEVVVDLGT